MSHHHHHHHQVNRRGAYLQSPAPLDFAAVVTTTSLGYFYATDISTLLHYGYAVSSESHYSRYINHNPLSYVRPRSINLNRAVPPRRGNNSEWRGTFQRQDVQESDESPGFMHSNWSREEETMILSGIDQVGGSSEDTNAGVSEEVVSRYLRTRNCDRMTRAAAEDDEEAEICVVCQDDLFDENQNIAALDCGHEFHTPCIKTWLTKKNACPLCNSIALPYR